MTRGVHLRQLAGVQIVDKLASTALMSAQWVAGAPLAIDANGLKKATCNAGTGACDIQYIAMKSWKDYQDSAEQVEGTVPSGLDTHKIYVIEGNNHILMYGDDYDNSGTITYPFAQTPSGGSWTVGDSVYLNSSEQWDDTAISSEHPYGVVTQVIGDPTAPDAIEIDFSRTVQLGA